MKAYSQKKKKILPIGLTKKNTIPGAYMTKKSVALAVILLSLSSAAHALEFQSLGSGSLGVGGAGVARTYGSMAAYWNPAGLAFAPKTATVSITAGVGLQPEGKLAQDLDDLSTAHQSLNSNQTLPNATTLFNAINALYETSSKDNLRASAGAAIGAQVNNFGFGVFGTFEGGAIPNPGGAPLPLPSASNLATYNTIANNALSTKTITTRGIALVEVPLAYGHAFDLGSAGKLGVGATGKYLYGEVASVENQQVFNSSSNSTISSSDLTKDLSNNRKGSAGFGIDLGLLWKPCTSTAVGFVGKNLNAPSFDTKTGDKIVVDRQIRAGVSVDALSWLELTGDVDVLSNSTIVPGLKSQHLGGGAEFHPVSCLKLRVGGYTDLAISTNGAVTGGLSLGIPWLFFDIDGAYGLGTVKYKNSSYPTEAKVQFSTNIAF